MTKYASRSVDVVDGHYFRSDIVAAGVTLVLAQLDRQNVNVNYYGSSAIVDCTAARRSQKLLFVGMHE
ncbi:hypothetical protein AB9F39_39425, partial [Rhizobium leguminosarum]